MFPFSRGYHDFHQDERCLTPSHLRDSPEGRLRSCTDRSARPTCKTRLIFSLHNDLFPFSRGYHDFHQDERCLTPSHFRDSPEGRLRSCTDRSARPTCYTRLIFSLHNNGFPFSRGITTFTKMKDVSPPVTYVTAPRGDCGPARTGRQGRLVKPGT